MALTLDADRSVLILVDLQENFLRAIPEAEAVLRRSLFLARSSQILGVPVFATEQYPEKMGSTHPSLVPHLSHPANAKLAFSAWGSSELAQAVLATGRPQVVIAGVETHICVTQTALDVLGAGLHAVVCPDAVASRTAPMHEIGLARLRDSGVIAPHSESVVYEWMDTAAHPRFKEVLAVVKGAL